MVPRVGQKIGPYEILGRLGSGGMGLVFSAWDARLHRDVAIKLLKDEFLNPTMRSRFLGEARAASRLNHPNICTIFDIGEEQDCPYMVMELLKGETLRGLMQQGSIPVETILQVATQVADALSVAHEQGIVHRDIKPANVVLVDKPNGTFQTKVLDFGLAKVDLGLDSHSGLTTTGMTVGTVSYMSPEQARGELLDGRSDLFSLGVVLYEMATKRLPFDGATSALIFVQLLNHPPEPMRNLNAAVPRALEQVINTCLQKNRAERYQSAQELVAALHKAAQQIGTGERSASWFTKFTTGLKRDSGAGNLTPPEPQRPEAPVEGPSPRQLSPEEAFLRPFKPSRKPASESRHYEPVNTPYTPAHDQQALEADAVDVSDENRSDETPASARLGAPTPSLGSVVASSKHAVPTSDSRTSIPEWLDDSVEAPPHDDQPILEAEQPSWRGWRILLGSLLAAATVVISVGVILSKRRPIANPIPLSVSISAIANHTGDNTLSSVMAAGLELSLQQSRQIGLRESGSGDKFLVNNVPQKGDASFAALKDAAKRRGAAAFAIGEIHMDGPSYSMSLSVYDTDKGNIVGRCASAALSRERIVGAIDGLAVNLRSVLGETGTSIHSSLPLTREATGNVDALSAYGLGAQAMASGRYLNAIGDFQHAVAIDTQFIQPRLRLAELYMREHAEVNAVDAVKQAQSIMNSDDREQLQARGLLELFATGDLQAASEDFSQLSREFPNDSTGFRWLATSQRLQGNFAAALASAEQASRLAPDDAATRNELQLALLALDRTDDALRIKEARTSAGGGSTNADQLAAFLHGNPTPIGYATQGSNPTDFEIQMTAAAILDASGQFNAGLTVWRAVADQAAGIPDLVSSAAFAFSQAALDHALAGDCPTALALGREASRFPAGPQAIFSFGMASGLCGNVEDARTRLNLLTSNYGESFALKGFYATDLNGLMQWKSGAVADALVTLQSASSYDSISFTPFLRGQVYLAQKQPQLATVEFQSMLRHPGQIVLLNTAELPMTDLALARAFAANGDIGNAEQSYNKLATMFESADPNGPILAEARLATGRLN